MSMFFYNIGRSVKIPLLDPGNKAYSARIEFLGSCVSKVVENWENGCGRSAVFCGLPEQLAYSLRRLAEMLPCSDFAKIAEQDFYKKAFLLADGQEEGDAEKAMEVLCSGLSDIHGCLDLGLDPFVEEASSGIEVISGEGKELTSGTARIGNPHGETSLSLVRQ